MVSKKLKNREEKKRLQLQSNKNRRSHSRSQAFLPDLQTEFLILSKKCVLIPYVLEKVFTILPNSTLILNIETFARCSKAFPTILSLVITNFKGITSGRAAYIHVSKKSQSGDSHRKAMKALPAPPKRRTWPRNRSLSPPLLLTEIKSL